MIAESLVYQDRPVWPWESSMRTHSRRIRGLAWPACAIAAISLGQAIAGPPKGDPTGLMTNAPSEDQHAQARLIAQQPAAVPGTILMLGVTFAIDEGWHLYWNGLNDTGVAPQIDLRLPEGFVAGDVLWPAPQRYITGDRDLLDHIYTDRVTLMIPVRVPQSLDKAALRHQTIRIEASVEWLVCDEACLSEFAELTLDLPVRVHVTADSPDGPLFAQARAKLPKAIKPAHSPIAASWDGTTLEIIAPAAAEVLYYPDATSSDLRDRFADAVARGSPLRLRFEPRQGEIARARGVLELLDAQRRTIGLFRIHLDQTESLELGPPEVFPADDTPDKLSGTTTDGSGAKTDGGPPKK